VIATVVITSTQTLRLITVPAECQLQEQRNDECGHHRGDFAHALMRHQYQRSNRTPPVPAPVTINSFKRLRCRP
jgi:hypothetical protein